VWSTGGPDDAPGRGEQVNRTRVWIELPDRARVEHRDIVAGTWSSTTVMHGLTFWAEDPHTGAFTNGGDPNHTTGLGFDTSLLDPVWLLTSGTVRHVGEAAVAGVTGLLVHIEPRPRPVFLPEWSPLEDPYGVPRELVLHPERGVALRDTSFLDGEPFHRVAFTEVRFDEPIPDELLVFTPSGGGRVRAARDVFPATVEAPLWEVAGRAGFMVLAPGTVDPSWSLTVHHAPGDGRRGLPEAVSLHYASPDASAQINVYETAVEAGGTPFEVAPDGGVWRTVDEGGGTYRVWEPTGADWPMPRHVVFEREGTAIRVMSDSVLTDALLSFARTFREASREPPAPAG